MSNYSSVDRLRTLWHELDLEMDEDFPIKFGNLFMSREWDEATGGFCFKWKGVYICDCGPVEQIEAAKELSEFMMAREVYLKSMESAVIDAVKILESYLPSKLKEGEDKK